MPLPTCLNKKIVIKKIINSYFFNQSLKNNLQLENDYRRPGMTNKRRPVRRSAHCTVENCVSPDNNGRTKLNDRIHVQRLIEPFLLVRHCTKQRLLSAQTKFRERGERVEQRARDSVFRVKIRLSSLAGFSSATKSQLSRHRIGC